MTTAARSTALATIQPVFTDPERLALAGFLAGYRGLTREAYALDLRQFTSWCRARSLGLFLGPARRGRRPVRCGHLADVHDRSRAARDDLPSCVGLRARRPCGRRVAAVVPRRSRPARGQPAGHGSRRRRASAVLNVFGASTGGESDASDLLGGLAELVGLAPASTVMTPAPYVAAKRYLADLGDEMASASLESAHNLSRSEYFNGPLPGDVVAALVRNLDADRRSGQARELDFTPWGGAYTRVPVPR
jgi:hypothetical protein